MSDDELPTGPEILSMFHPAQLFGERIGDGRALRRYWARLARTFRDTEPDVFQHARWLYERARDCESASRVRPVETSELSGKKREAAESQLAPPIGEWLANRDAESLVWILEFDPGAVLGRASMFDVLSVVLEVLGVGLTPSQLDAIRREMAHHTLRVTPKQELSLRTALANVVWVSQVAAHEQVGPEVLAVVEACRRKSVPAFVHAMDRLVDPACAVDATDALRRLRQHVPRAWTLVQKTLNAFVTPLKTPRAFVPWRLLRTFGKPRGVSGAFVGKLLLLSFGLFSMVNLVALMTVYGAIYQIRQDPFSQFLTVPATGAALLTVLIAYPMDRVRRLRGKTGQTDGIRELAVRYALFPFEAFHAVRVALGALGKEPDIIKEIKTLADDPMWLAECWTAAHARRLLTAHEATR